MQFEQLFEITKQLVAARNTDQRDVTWCDPAKQIGLAISSTGGFEVFIRADGIQPTSPLVRRHVKQDCWQGSTGQFSASRIALPAEPHYQPVAAFIAEEIIRNGLAESPPLAFARSEPIIEMVLRRTALSDELILGLIGELRILNLFLSLCDSREQRVCVIGSWTGYRHSAHDFHVPGMSIEVKTTRSTASIHPISGIHQVDPRRDIDGSPTERLYLLSIGLDVIHGSEASADNITLPGTVAETLRLLGDGHTESERVDAQRLILARIREYGGTNLGYDHDSMSTWPAYTQSFRPIFVRALRYVRRPGRGSSRTSFAGLHSGANRINPI